MLQNTYHVLHTVCSKVGRLPSACHRHRQRHPGERGLLRKHGPARHRVAFEEILLTYHNMDMYIWMYMSLHMYMNIENHMVSHSSHLIWFKLLNSNPGHAQGWPEDRKRRGFHCLHGFRKCFLLALYPSCAWLRVDSSAHARPANFQKVEESHPVRCLGLEHHSQPLLVPAGGPDLLIQQSSARRLRCW